MMKTFFPLLGIAVCSLLLAMPLSAASQAKSSKKTAPPEKTEKTAPSTQAVKSRWAPETLTGSIMSVDSAKKLVVIKGSDGVPYDAIVNKSTRIESGGKKVTLDELQSDTGKQVSVRVVPKRSGDMARSIEVTG